MFAATPPPIKPVLQPDSSETVKPQKQIKSSNRTEKDSDERTPIIKNKENKSIDRKTIKIADNMFQQKVKIRNAKELSQKFPTKEDLKNGYLKEHFKNHEILISEINRIENYVILAPSNSHCFNKIMKDETVKNIILNCGLHPENVHRLKRKNGNPTT